MFNRKLLVVAVATTLVGCNFGSDQESNRSYKSIPVSTNLLSGEAIAKSELKNNPHFKSEFSIINQNGKVERPKIITEFREQGSLKPINDAQCPTSDNYRIYDYADLGGNLAIIHMGTEIITESRDKNGKLSCWSGEEFGDYIVRKSDGKAWEVPQDQHSSQRINYSYQVQQSNTAHNSTNTPLIVTGKCSSYGCDESLLAIVEPTTGSDEKITFKEILTIQNGSLNGSLNGFSTYNGSYLATRGSSEKTGSIDYYFNVANGTIPEFARGEEFDNHLPIIDPVSNDMVLIKNNSNQSASVYLLSNELKTIIYDIKEDDYIDFNNGSEALFNGNGVNYIVNSDSTIISDETGLLSTKYKGSGYDSLITAKQNGEDSQLYVINKKYAVIIDYATSSLKTIELNKGKNIAEASTARISGNDILSFKVSGRDLFETVYRTLDLKTGEFGKDRIIKSEDGRKVIEVLPIN